MSNTENDTEQHGGEDHRDVPTVDPEVEPECVGAYSARVTPECRNWKEPHADGKCGEPSTHTVVMYHNGGLDAIAMCDDCGEPEDVRADDRVWSGIVEGLN